jgi:hypothetical protein
VERAEVRVGQVARRRRPVVVGALEQVVVVDVMAAYLTHAPDLLDVPLRRCPASIPHGADSSTAW